MSPDAESATRDGKKTYGDTRAAASTGASNGRENGPEASNFDSASRAAYEALALLPDYERTRILTHVAALVAMSPKRRAAILGLTDDA